MLKDIIFKPLSLSGFTPTHLPGCNYYELPIELIVGKKAGKFTIKTNIGRFRRECCDLATQQTTKLRQDFMHSESLEASGEKRRFA